MPSLITSLLLQKRLTILIQMEEPQLLKKFKRCSSRNLIRHLHRHRVALTILIQIKEHQLPRRCSSQSLIRHLQLHLVGHPKLDLPGRALVALRLLISPAEVRPPPKEKEKQKKKIHRNRGATAILTSSPYKAKLLSNNPNPKANAKERKVKQKKEKPKGKEEDARKKKGKEKERNPHGRKGKKRKIENDSSSEEENEEWLPLTDEDDNDDGDSCMICNQLVSETALGVNWSICSVCKDVAHDICSGIDPDDGQPFLCNFCTDLVAKFSLK